MFQFVSIRCSWCIGSQDEGQITLDAAGSLPCILKPLKPAKVHRGKSIPAGKVKKEAIRETFKPTERQDKNNQLTFAGEEAFENTDNDEEEDDRRHH